MKTITEQVYSRLVWHVTGNLSPAEQADYWRIYWHYKQSIAAHTAGLATKVLTLVGVLLFGLGLRNIWLTLAIALVGCVLLFAVKVHARAHMDCAQRILNTDLAKWQAIADTALSVCQACSPGDRTEEVIITLPDA